MNFLPIAKRVFHKTLSLDLIEVKPMSAPMCKIFYMESSVGKKHIRKSKINSLFN